MGFDCKSVWCLFLLLISAVCSNDPCDSLGTEMCPERDDLATAAYSPSRSGGENALEQLIRNQNVQLDRLENLVKHLAESIREFLKPQESLQKEEIHVENVREATTGSSHLDHSVQAAAVEPSQPAAEERPEADQKQETLGISSPIKAPKGRIVARYKPAWSEHFQFLSAVRVDAPLSCLHILPHESEDGLGKYIAVGDEAGHLYIFSAQGDLLVDYASLCTAPVTVIISVVLRRNETLLVTGHSNGAVLAHRVWETVHEGGSSSSSFDDFTSLSIQYGHSFKSDAHGTKVVNLEMYRIGRMRYLLVAAADGKIQVFRDNGTLYGTAESHSRPLAFLRSSSTQRLLFLTTSGAASLDLRTMTVRSSRCQGLNNSSLVAYAFDAAGRSKAYGVTEDGSLIYVALSGDTLHFDCHAMTKRKLELQGPVKLQGLKGYILIATPRDVSVYNTTQQQTATTTTTTTTTTMTGPRSVFTASMSEISQTFLQAGVVVTPAKEALLVCDREKLVVLGFGEGYVGIFKSNLPLQSAQEIGAKFWGTPVFVSITGVAMAWYFFTRKREQHAEESSSSADRFTAAGVSGVSAAAAAAAGGGGSVGVGNTSSVGQAVGVDNSATGALRTYEKMRSGLGGGEGSGSLMDDARRFSSPSRVYGPAGAAASGYGVVGSVNYRNTAVPY